MGMLTGGFKTRKPRQFEYKPRYHDPDKQELEARVKEAERKYGVEQKPGELPDYKNNIKTQMRQNKDYSGMKDRNFKRIKIIIRSITIALILIIAAMVYQIFKHS